MIAPLLALSLLASPPSGADASVSRPAPKEKGFDALAIPLISFNSDDGFGLGAVGGAYLYRPGAAPYAHAFSAQTYFTKKGVQSHFLRYDAPHFLNSPLRFEAKVELRREKFAPFYGLGNGAAPDFQDAFDRDPFHTYDRLSYGGWTRLRLAPLGFLADAQPYVGYDFHQTRIQVNSGSLLEETHPVGIDGGPNGMAMVGVLWDHRNDEADPTRGGSQELSFRLAEPYTGSRYHYGQVTLTVRQFWTLFPDVVLGERFVADHQFGEVPFFEWQNLGGLSPAEGLGGMTSVRGLPRDRYLGTTKLLLNSEVRWIFAKPVVFGQLTKLGGVGFVDVGRVDAPNFPDGDWFRVHPGGGLGLRIVRRQAVVRFDYALSQDRQAIYLTFGHLF